MHNRFGPNQTGGRVFLFLNTDDFWPVRVVASKGLRTMQSDESFEALKSSMKQSNARVRKQVVSDVTSFFRPAAFEQAQVVLNTEKNPDIVKPAILVIEGVQDGIDP